jgi:hypothetical protein
LRQCADGFCWLEEGATGCGCFRGPQAWPGNRKKLLAQGNPGGASEAQTGALESLEEIKAKNPRSGRKMSDAIFIANKVSGRLAIGDKREIDKATWRRPRGIRLTPTSRYIRDKLFPKRG